MAKINPETATAAHNIAKIFCDHNYDEIAKRARYKHAETNPKGDKSGFIAKELWDEYSAIFEVVLSAAAQDPDLGEFSCSSDFIDDELM